MSGCWFIQKNRSGGCPVGYTTSICAARCLCMQPLWGRKNTTGQSTVARVGSCSHKASLRRLPLWKVSTLTSPGRRSRACTMRYTSFKGYLVGAVVKRPQKRDSERKSWPPSGSTYGLACHWKMKRNIHCLPLPKEILKLGTMVPSTEHTRDLQPGSRVEMMRGWPLPGMPTAKPWLWLLYSRRGLKGWAILPADSTPEAASDLEAANILAVST